MGKAGGRSAASDDLSNRVTESGIIQPGAHPERGAGPQISNPIEQIGNFFGRIGQRLNTSGNRRSPSTQMDRRGAMPRSDAQVQADYAADVAKRRKRAGA